MACVCTLKILFRDLYVLFFLLENISSSYLPELYLTFKPYFITSAPMKICCPPSPQTTAHFVTTWFCSSTCDVMLKLFTFLSNHFVRTCQQSYCYSSAAGIIHAENMDINFKSNMDFDFKVLVQKFYVFYYNNKKAKMPKIYSREFHHHINTSAVGILLFQRTL